MSSSAKISQKVLRSYFLADFAHGRDLDLGYKGEQLVDTTRSGGQLSHTAGGGFPVLKDDFLDHIEENDSDAAVTYDQVAAVYASMNRPDDGTPANTKLRHLHKALTWLAFDRRNGVTQEQLAEALEVCDRTIRIWLKQAIAHVRRELLGPVPAQVIKFPPGYEPALSTSA